MARRLPFLLLVFAVAGCGSSGHARAIDARNADELVVSKAPAGTSAGAATRTQNGGLRRKDVQEARNQHDIRAGRWCFGQDLQRGALLGRGTTAIYPGTRRV